MWTSRPRGPRARPAPMRRALDAFGFAVAFAFLPELIGVRAGVVLEPHPGWIAVLVLAARYGSGGLFTGLIAVAGATVIGSALAGTGLVTSWSRLESTPNLIAFGACLTVSWVASWHLRREADLSERLRAVSGRAADSQAAIEALRGGVATLRSRVDRTSTSLSFLRDAAVRLEGTDPVAAAEGAAELALARTGACAVAVEVGMNGFRRVLAVRDARGPMMLAPLVVSGADLIVPILKGSGRIGVIALWGIHRSGLDDATANDLAVIASWCAPALAIVAWRSEEAVGHARSVR